MQTTRILLVEDDARVAMLFADLLEGADYQVTKAPNGKIGLQFLNEAYQKSLPYQVVITDLMMPGVGGLEVLQAARSQQPPADVIVLTGFGTLPSALGALRAGAYDYLLKPCKAAQLLACVASAVEQSQTRQRQDEWIKQLGERLDHKHFSDHKYTNGTTATPAPAAPEASNDRYLYQGQLRLDRLDYLAFFNDQPIALTPTEYALLYCLLEAHGRVLSYQEIVQHTHGHTTSTTEAQALLKAHVSHLRRKIDSSYLITIRGVGYMLNSA